jgi:hypothetical protein
MPRDAVRGNRDGVRHAAGVPYEERSRRGIAAVPHDGTIAPPYGARQRSVVHPPPQTRPSRVLKTRAGFAGRLR